MPDDFDKTSLAWKQIASDWSTYFTPPSRISKDEIGKYREWLAKINPGKKPLCGLVLGATPELRDAMFELGYKVHSIDINLEMFLAMSELLKNKNPAEVFVKSNWLDNPLASNYFDVIAGDAVLPNIPWDKRQDLISEVRRLLKPDGIFLTRAFCVPDKKRFKSVGEVLAHFSKKEANMQSALEMVLELHILTYDPRDHLGSFAKARAALEKYHGENGSAFGNTGLQKTHDVVWNFWCTKFVNKVFTYAYRGEEEKEYKKLFEIACVFEAKDHGYGRITPMYFLNASAEKLDKNSPAAAGHT